jgi:catechol 2,3-dioxygenase-like lactoylglutathione lyase family enzyme
MRDFRDAKLMAKSLRAALAADGVEVSTSRSLELIARTFGLETWNVLSAKIKQEPAATRRSETPGDDPAPVTALPDKIAQIEVGCTDLAAAKAYYSDVLGLPVVGEIADSIFVRCGEINLIVQRSANPRRGRTVYFSGDGRVREATAALKARGVSFTEEPRRIARLADGIDVWLGFFDDPWGNPYGLLANMPADATPT